jgi:hypothetical protein
MVLTLLHSYKILKGLKNVANQAIFMNSNSRRNFTSSKKEGSGIAATSFGSNQSISQGAIVG